MSDISGEMRLDGGIKINLDIGSLSQGPCSHLQNEAQRNAVAFCVPYVHSWKDSGLALSGTDFAEGIFTQEPTTCKRWVALEMGSFPNRAKAENVGVYNMPMFQGYYA
jgi:hypothetical protein